MTAIQPDTTASAAMSIRGPEAQDVTSELDIMQRCLPLAGAKILELGCGGAEKTRMLAERYPDAQLVAAEVDEVAHASNLKIDDLANVTFACFGAEAIPYPEASFDLVLMFKSLHHVPESLLTAAFAEIHRVLAPGGLLYISEPVFAGAFNEVIRLFHDEERVRRSAFDATVAAVESTDWTLETEIFFKNRLTLTGFEQFERGIIGATHTEHSLSAETLTAVRNRFEQHASAAGYVFEIPNRVDVLKKA